MTNNPIHSVPRELLADLLGNDHDKRIMAERHLLAMLANAPSPAGVDGLEGMAPIDQPPALSPEEIGEKAVQDHVNWRQEQEAEAQLKAMDEPFVVPSQDSMALAIIRLHTLRLITDRVLACLLAANVLLDVAKPGKDHKVDNRLDEWLPKNSLRDMERIHWRSAVLQLHRFKFLPTREVVRHLNRAIQPRFSATKGKRPERQPGERPVKVCSECLQQDCNGECISNLN